MANASDIKVNVDVIPGVTTEALHAFKISQSRLRASLSLLKLLVVSNAIKDDGSLAHVNNHLNVMPMPPKERPRIQDVADRILVLWSYEETTAFFITPTDEADRDKILQANNNYLGEADVEGADLAAEWLYGRIWNDYEHGQHWQLMPGVEEVKGTDALTINEPITIVQSGQLQ